MKKGTFVERMKTKNFYIVVGLIVISSGTIWLLNYPSSTFQSIVTKTHKGIKNLPNNIQIQTSRELTVNPLYLSRLGLDEQQVSQSRKMVYPGDSSSLPVIASSVEGEGEKMENALMLMESVKQHLATFQLVMFDLTSSETTHVLLKKYCNSSWNCEVRKFEFDKYPSHVADLSVRSYRPICIQEMLREYGGLIWADAGRYLQSSNLTSVLSQARKVGLVAWTIEDPTSAITHPKMFHFFKTRQELYYFHRAVESSHLVLFESPTIIEKIMLPWVKCALLEDCINPTGAQNVGCNFMRKPLFKYSGCHYYDMSALNVILGPLFDFDERAYSSKETVFGSLVDDRLAAKNSSDPLHRSRLKLREYLNGKGESVA
ncbi:uncharacterized protein LOC143301722 [Babylonia areolata]|uniref:uncharacterized protein LOC143301722 n=1 Tax=Babylonia areolata TaxID=304850 RepID=UPI003FD39BEC